MKIKVAVISVFSDEDVTAFVTYQVCHIVFMPGSLFLFVVIESCLIYVCVVCHLCQIFAFYILLVSGCLLLTLGHLGSERAKSCIPHHSSRQTVVLFQHGEIDKGEQSASFVSCETCSTSVMQY